MLMFNPIIFLKEKIVNAIADCKQVIAWGEEENMEVEVEAAKVHLKMYENELSEIEDES